MSVYNNVYNIFEFITNVSWGWDILFETSADIFINTFKDDINEFNKRLFIFKFNNAK